MRSVAAGLSVSLWIAGLALCPPFAEAAERAANELGSVMILEYHRIGEPEGRWTRTPRHLREDLEALWRGGYRAVGLTAFVAGTFDLPAGATPVVLTFDDSSPGQFRYRERGGGPQVDPDCAVGILEEFERLHPEFGLAATFFVLPAAAEPNRLFGQPEYEAHKIRYLVSRGFQVGNHTFWHADLSRYPETVVTSQLARAQESIDRIVPGYRLRALSLPMGSYPRQIEWAIRGQAAGVRYEHEAILMVGGGPAPSPFSTRFDPYHLPRVQVVGSTLAHWLERFDRHPDERYVSDGDPATVTVPRGHRRDARIRSGPALQIIERE